MPLQFDDWSGDWSMTGLFFTVQEIDLIRNRLHQMPIDQVFYCSFENRFAKSGGLAAVAVNILPFLKETNHIKAASLISPFYPHIMARAPLQSTGQSFRLFFDSRFIDVEILEYKVEYQKPATGWISEFYLKADGFFAAQNPLNDPYHYVLGDPDANDEAIRYNAAFYCKAVPAALVAMGIRQNVILHAQEWQTSLVSLTAKEAMSNDLLSSCAVVQTIHNPFDSYFSAENLKKMVDEPRKLRIDHMLNQGATAFQIALPLTDGPTSTVSENFAREYTSDILQTEHFAPHLQGIFSRNGVHGVNNGPFIGFSAEFPKRGGHSLQEIRAIKQKNRKALLDVLDTYNPEERFGQLTFQNGSICQLPDEVPIIVMSGRLDPVQKGYDILLRALERFGRDEIKAILTPMAVRSSDLDYFHEVASKCRGNLTVFPIRMQHGYQALQSGATYGIMPSVYEPFGAAIEYLVNGTAVIARATGGLVNQVDHGESGFLFREDQRYYDLDHIRHFVQGAEVVQLRKSNGWVQDMAESLYQTLKMAAGFYRQNSDGYYEMVRIGFSKAEEFSWETSASMYGQIFSKAVSI
jgi:glycogen synthase